MALLSFIGLIAIVTKNSSLTVLYIGLSAPLLFAVAIGGIASYWSQDVQDWKDMKDETIRLLREKIKQLELKRGEESSASGLPR